jgi:hypothetical protein
MKRIAGIIAVSLSLIACDSNPKEQGKIEVHKPTYTITPPIAEYTPEAEQFEIDATNDTVLISEKGSFISVPANSFIDEAGAIVESVKVDFIEYDNPADILFSGIPMEYTDENETGTFQSAGMCKIEATSDGKTVQIAEDKALSIGMRNKAQEEDYNLYFFNENKGEWVEKEENIAVANAPVTPILRATADSSRIIHITIRNAKMRPTYRTWDNSEFYMMQGVTPKYTDDEIFWYDMDVIPTADPDQYVVKFKGVSFGQQCVEALLVQPMIDADNYRSEMKAFKKRMRNYAKALLENDNQIEEDKKAGKLILARIENENPVEDIETGREIIARIEKEEKERHLRDSSIIADQQIAEKIQTDVMRTFQVNNLGLYNCDRFYKRAIEKTVDLTFVHNGQNLAFSYAALCAPKDNAVLSYLPFSGMSYGISISPGTFYFIGIQGKQLYSAPITMSTKTGEIQMDVITKSEFERMMGA